MEAKHMNEALLMAFPELEAEFNEYVSWQDGLNTGAFLTYEDVFRPHIEAAILANDAPFLLWASNFIEDLLLSQNPYAVNVATIGLLEGLKANCEANAARAFLKPAALSAYDELTL